MSDPSFSRTDRIAHAVMIGLLSVVATLGFVQGGLWAGATFVSVALLTVLAWIREKRFPWPDRTIGLAAIVFPMGAACLAPFSPFPEEAFGTALKISSIFIPLSFLSARVLKERGRRLEFIREDYIKVLTFGFIALSVVCALASLFFGFDSRPMTKLNRGLSYGLFAAAPLLALCARDGKKKEGLLLIGAVLAALFLTHSRTTQAAAIAGVSAFFLTRLWPRIGKRVLESCFALSLALPLIVATGFRFGLDALSHLPRTLLARIEIWDYMAHRISEKPLLGWGIGSSGKLPWSEPNGALYVFTNQPAAHPHNAIIQLWVETGLWGLLGGISVGLWLFRAVGALEKNMRPYAYGALAFGGVLLMAAYNLWTDSLWAAMALGVYLFDAVSFDKKAEKNAP